METLFMRAAKNGETKLVKDLLSRVDPTLKQNYAIRKASMNGHTEIVKILLQDGRAIPDSDMLREASKKGHAGVVGVLLQDGRADPTVYDLRDGCALTAASAGGHSEVVELLLKDPRPVRLHCFRIMIREASSKGHTEVVKLLLKDPRVNPGIDDSISIRFAGTNGHREVLKLLLKDPRVDASVCSAGAIQLFPEDLLRSKRVRKKLGKKIPKKFAEVWHGVILKRYTDLILLASDMSKRLDLNVIMWEGVFSEQLDDVTPHIDDPPEIRVIKFMEEVENHQERQTKRQRTI